MDRYHLSWDDVHTDSMLLASLLRNQKDKDWFFKTPFVICAITRGGLFVAGLLAFQLGLKDITTICLESYEDETKKGEINCIREPKMGLHNILIVDDLLDSGETMQYAVNRLKGGRELRIAVLYHKNKHRLHHHFYCTRKVADVWIVFPWEKHR